MDAARLMVTDRTKIIVVTFMEEGQVMISHGIKMDTMETVCLPQIPIDMMRVYFDDKLNEYVLW